MQTGHIAEVESDDETYRVLLSSGPTDMCIKYKCRVGGVLTFGAVSLIRYTKKNNAKILVKHICLFIRLQIQVFT